jgi:predicted nucleic acid-binding protein
LILVDTSAWIDFFRGIEPLASRVDALLADDEVAVCGPILTELRRGLQSAAERRRVLSLLLACHELPQPPDLWTEAGDLGFALRRRGSTVKTLDLLIATWALGAGLPILTGDTDFGLIRRAGVPLQLA